MRTRRLAFSLAICATFQLPCSSNGQTPNPATAANELFDSEGYRSARYRAPVDLPPFPAVPITLAKALRLRAGVDALFIDVLPAEGGVRDAATGQWTLGVQHDTIPGAAWHPEAGRGEPDPLLWRGLRDAVQTARARRPALPVVVFCRSDCWMSWNAARRLAREGFSEVYWLAEGIEGWHQAGRVLVRAEPIAIAPR